ncbi:MAG: transporter [Muribaculaceae bacterium]|nr:transporter [Muribaculaceae bacterium]
MHTKLQSLKSGMLPIALICGAVFYKWMGYLTFLSPYLIFAMLFITYCKLELKDFRIGRFQWILLAVQMLLSAATYCILLPAGHVVAEGVFICVFVPTATAAPVITGMLGGSISKVATYSLLCNIVVSIIGPGVLAAVGDHAEYTFFESLTLIMAKVLPLLLLPIVCALVLTRFAPKLHKKLANSQSLSFYLWAVALVIIVGSCVSFVINNWSPEESFDMIMLTLGALCVCLLQFKAGRVVGRRFGESVSGGQGLGQKNTVLAVWLALAYMNPVASVAPAAYIAFQNIINSWQLIRHKNS